MVLFFSNLLEAYFPFFFYILDGCSKQASCFSKRKNSASIYFTDKILTGKVQKHLTKSNCHKMKLVRLDFSRPNFVREVDRSKILEEFYKISNAIWFLWTFHYRKVASSRLSWSIWCLYLWPLVQRGYNWIVNRTTAHDFTVHIYRFCFFFNL